MPSILADLLMECNDLGIRLALAGDCGFEIDAPRHALTPDLLAKLKTHKAELLGKLRTAPEASAELIGDSHVPVEALQRPILVCRCGSTAWRDVPIHAGQSIRRVRDRCGLFLGFPVWSGKDTGHIGQHPV